MLTFPLLGPVYLLPLWFWRAFKARVRSPGLRGAATALAAYAGVVGLLVAAGQLVGGSAGRLAATLQPYSPWHAVASDLFLRLAHAGIDTTAVACLELAICWALVAASCTVLLAPLYLWLLGRREVLARASTRPAKL